MVRTSELVVNPKCRECSACSLVTKWLFTGDPIEESCQYYQCLAGNSCECLDGGTVSSRRYLPIDTDTCPCCGKLIAEDKAYRHEPWVHILLRVAGYIQNPHSYEDFDQLTEDIYGNYYNEDIDNLMLWLLEREVCVDIATKWRIDKIADKHLVRNLWRESDKWINTESGVCIE